MTIGARLAELNIELPPATSPIANYTTALQDGDLLYLSGHVCRRDGAIVSGRAGDDVSVDIARELARSVAIDILSTIEAAAGLNRVRKIVRIAGYIRSAPGFGEQPAVLNGASDLMVEVFGPDIGTHSRSAIGVSELPGGAVVEIDAIVRIA